ncbi:MAG: isoamylase early set domain-containing protein [Gemmatimonadales bacterium]
MTTDHELDAPLRRATDALRQPIQPMPGFEARVMEAVRAERQGGAHWLLRSRAVSLSPLAAIAAAALLVAGAALTTWAVVRDDVPAQLTSAGSAAQTVRFVIAAPEAGSVALVGSFNDWDLAATPLQPAPAGGVWTVEIPLAPGRHEYAFVVDGVRWLVDPTAPASAADFGPPNSVVTVAGSS